MKKIEIVYRNQKNEIDYFFRRGQKITVLYLHGLGCSKLDFIKTAETKLPRDYSLIAFDFPGHGGSNYPEKLEIDDLVEITNLVIEKLNLNNIVLIGHSMGGLIALLFAKKYIDKVRAFINVEGNLKNEDCFFSRQVAETSFKVFQQKIFQDFKFKLQKSDNFGLKKYAEALEEHQLLSAFYDYCPSMVEYSDSNTLINKFVSLEIPKIFIYGSENSGLSYIPELKQKNCTVAEISESNHFPQIDNPTKFYKVISNFLRKIS